MAPGGAIGDTAAVGTPEPMSDDFFETDPEAWYFGVLLFELLSGRTPEIDHGPGRGSAPALPEELKLPARLRGLVGSLLAPSPEARPRSATAVRDELDAISAELTRAAAVRDRQAVRLQPPPRLGEPVLVPARPEPRSAGHLQLALVGGLVVLAIGAVVWLPRWAEAPAALPTASPTPAPSPVTASLAEAPRVDAPRAEAAPPVVEIDEPPRPVMPPRGAAVRPKEDEAPAAAPESAPAPEPEPTPDLQAQARMLAGHREQGALLESREDWRGALAQYTAALAIDPHLTFALEGRERTEKRAALTEALELHLKRPDRLSAPAVAREVEGLLERARGAEPAGPTLHARIVALEAALTLARTPVAVVIESDGFTELVLSRVGRLGTLTRRSLELVPGNYTLTGSRRGYRDVRRQFNLTPGARAPSVSLRCEKTL